MKINEKQNLYAFHITHSPCGTHCLPVSMSLSLLLSLLPSLPLSVSGPCLQFLNENIEAKRLTTHCAFLCPAFSQIAAVAVATKKPTKTEMKKTNKDRQRERERSTKHYINCTEVDTRFIARFYMHIFVIFQK